MFGPLTLHLDEIIRDVRKECIALDLPVDNSQINFVHLGNGLAKNVFPTTDKCLVRSGACCKSRDQIVDDNASGTE